MCAVAIIISASCYSVNSQSINGFNENLMKNRANSMKNTTRRASLSVQSSLAMFDEACQQLVHSDSRFRVLLGQYLDKCRLSQYQ